MFLLLHSLLYSLGVRQDRVLTTRVLKGPVRKEESKATPQREPQTTSSEVLTTQPPPMGAASTAQRPGPSQSHTALRDKARRP